MNPNLPPLATVRDQVADWLLLSRSIPAGAIIDTATPAVVALRAIRDDAGIIVTTLHEGLTDAEAERDALHARAEAAEAERDALRARALIADQWRAFALEVALQVAPLGEEQRAAQTTVRDLPAVTEALREVVAERDRADQRADRAYAYKVVAENEAAALRARAEAAEAALATARAEGAAAERAAVVAWLRTHGDGEPVGPFGVVASPEAARFARMACEDVAAGRHVRPVEDA